MLDIYKKLKTAEDGEENRTKRDVSEKDVFLSAADQYAIDQSDIIMTFLNKSKKKWFKLSDFIALLFRSSHH